MRKTLAMLLAGGKGTRLNILARLRAKPAVPFGGIYRIIDFTLSNVMHSGLTRVGILTQYKPLSLMEHIGNGQAWDLVGRTREAKILPPSTGEKDSDWYKGTADAIAQNMDYIKGHKPERVLILSGDHIYKMDYSLMVKYHKDKGADLTIAMMEVPIKDAHQFGIAITDSNDRIVDWEEKPKEPKSNLASMGIYVFNSEALYKYLGPERCGNDFGKEIIAKMINEAKVYAYRFKGYWRDVGTLQSYWDANMDLLDPNSGIELEKWCVRTNMDVGRIGDRAPARILKGAKVVDSIISPGCVIEGEVTNCIISPGVIVKKGALLHGSVIMHDVVIGENATIDNTIIDKDVVIGNNCLIGHGSSTVPNERFPSHLSTGLTIIGKGSVIPEGTKIGRNVIMYPMVKANKVPKEVPAGATIESELGLF